MGFGIEVYILLNFVILMIFGVIGVGVIGSMILIGMLIVLLMFFVVCFWVVIVMSVGFWGLYMMYGDVSFFMFLIVGLLIGNEFVFNEMFDVVVSLYMDIVL